MIIDHNKALHHHCPISPGFCVVPAAVDNSNGYMKSVALRGRLHSEVCMLVRSLPSCGGYPVSRLRTTVGWLLSQSSQEAPSSCPKGPCTDRSFTLCLSPLLSHCLSALFVFSLFLFFSCSAYGREEIRIGWQLGAPCIASRRGIRSPKARK